MEFEPLSEQGEKVVIKTTPSIRDTIFIGHANPEDNDFTLWLRAKLINEGYKVECDLTFLTGGENDYWKSLQDLLENGTVKYILVYSKNTFEKPGVIEEWEQVKAIAAQHQLNDFRLVCKIDDVSFSQRIGLNVMNQIRFDKAWGFGLKQLLNKLRTDRVPHGKRNQYSIDDWLRNKFTTNPFLKKKKETYYSNWLHITTLPDVLYIHKFENNSQAKLISNEFSYPSIVHDKYIITFLEIIPQTAPSINFSIEAKSTIVVKTEYYLSNVDELDFPCHVDMKRFIVRLLKDAFFKTMENKGVPFHSMSNRLRCYYYKEGQIENNKVAYLYEGNWMRPKQLIGEYFESMWHYGISIRPILRPFLRFAIKGHLVFSDDGQNVWEKKKELQSARKTKGKGFYNADWRNLMLAFLHSIADDEGLITIELNESFSIKLPATPVLFHSTYGYDEPDLQARLIPLDNDSSTFMEGEEMFDIEENDYDESVGDDVNDNLTNDKELE